MSIVDRIHDGMKNGKYSHTHMHARAHTHRRYFKTVKPEKPVKKKIIRALVSREPWKVLRLPLT